MLPPLVKAFYEFHSKNICWLLSTHPTINTQQHKKRGTLQRLGQKNFFHPRINGNPDQSRKRRPGEPARCLYLRSTAQSLICQRGHVYRGKDRWLRASACFSLNASGNEAFTVPVNCPLPWEKNGAQCCTENKHRIFREREWKSRTVETKK